MKQINTLVIIVFIIIGMYSCQNDEWSFSDFDYTTTYFPYQYPVRTLVLGDYYFDNTNDNLHKFTIGAHMGGGYGNEEDILVEFTLDESLTNNMYLSSVGTPIKALPTEYYTLSNSSQIVIAKGDLSGTIEVQLTPAFFEDTLAIGTNYVIPLTIISSTTDSVLMGSPAKDSADPRVSTDWTILPKYFTLFGIKYVNEYHGKYLLRGTSVITEADGSIVETIVYREKYVEQNSVVSLLTYRRNAVKYSNSIRQSSGGSPGSFEMNIAFDANNLAVISNTPQFPQFPVTGTAKMVEDAEEWGEKKRDVIYLDYQVQVGTQTHQIKDTLVFRDKAVVFEEYVPQIIVP